MRWQLKTTHSKLDVERINFPVYESASVRDPELFKQYKDVTKPLRDKVTCLLITTPKTFNTLLKTFWQDG